jgi:hypothetical protein
MFKKAIHYFLYRVPAVDDLPPPVAALVRRHLHDYDGIVAVPPQDYPIVRTGWRRALPFTWRTTPARTLVFGRQRILMVEAAPGAEPQAIIVPLDALLCSEVTVDLLYAYLRLLWTEGGHQRAVTVEFNTTGMRLLRQHLDVSRASISADGTLPVMAPGGTLDDLPLKFNNYTRYALLPGEQVEAVSFHAAPPRPRGWMLLATAQPSRSFTMTNLNLIVIEELIAWPASPYGLRTLLIPRRQIRAVTWDTDDSGGQQVCLLLGAAAPGVRLCYPVTAAEAAAWQPLPAAG